MKWIKATVILFSLVMLSSCWDRQELNDVSFVTGMAIEKGEKAKYELTLEIVNASELNTQSAGDSTATISFTMEGDTIAELDDKMNVGITRALNFSHTHTIVIDENLAREGVGPFLQYIERSAEFRNDFHLLIARGVKARDIISTPYPVQKVPSLKLDTQLKAMNEKWGGYPDMRFTDFTTSISSEGRRPVASAVTIEGDSKKGQSKENNQKTNLDAQVVIAGLAIFKKDKLIDFLSIEETRDYVWTQDIKQTTFTTPCNEGDSFFSIDVFNSNTKMSAKYKQGVPHLKVELVLEGEIKASQCKEDETSKIKTYEKYEKLMKAEVEKQIKGTITKVQQKYGLDIFGFGEQMNREQYQKFKQVKDNWDEEFKKAEIEVKAKVFLRRDGIRSESFLKDLDE